MVDAADLKSVDLISREGSSPSSPMHLKSLLHKAKRFLLSDDIFVAVNKLLSLLLSNLVTIDLWLRLVSPKSTYHWKYDLHVPLENCFYPLLQVCLVRGAGP
jgi:hypothetical protein